MYRQRVSLALPRGAALAIGASLLLLTACGPSQEEVRQREQLQAQVSQLQQQVEGLQTSLAQMEEIKGSLQSVVAEKDKLLTQMDKLRADLESKATEIESLQADLSGAREEVKREQGRLAELQKAVTGVKATIAAMDTDRLFLAELRKDFPDEKETALQFWQHVKALAVKSDPAFGPKLDRIIAASGRYFNWREATFATVDEQEQQYFAMGASQYFVLVNGLMDDVLFHIVLRIQTLTTQIGST